MKNIYLVSIMLFSMFGFSQDYFEQGYYIDKAGMRTDGLINNGYWSSSPTKIMFKKNTDDTSIELGLSTLREFGIGDKVKYICRTVMIDKLPNVNDKVMNSLNNDPQFVSKIVFLKVLVDGNVSLYVNTEENSPRFFLGSLESNELKQLVYKSYLDNDGRKKENRTYRIQLFESLQCESLKSDAFRKLQYQEKDLMDIITAYNACKGTPSKEYKESVRKSKIKFTLFAGFVMSSYNVTPVEGKPFTKEGNYNPYFGAEIALIFPFDNNKYELFSTLSYETISSTNISGKTSNSGASYLKDNVVSDFSVINIGFGPRYNFFVSTNNRLFVDGNFGLSFPSGSVTYTTERFNATNVEFVRENEESLQTSMFINLGIGYVYKQKFGINLRTDLLNKDFITGSSYLNSTKYIGVSLALRYTIN